MDLGCELKITRSPLLWSNTLSKPAVNRKHLGDVETISVTRTLSMIPKYLYFISAFMTCSAAYNVE